MRATAAIIFLLLFAVAAGPAALASAEGSFSRTLQVSGPAVVDVTTGSGDITVRAGEAGVVRIHARIEAHGGLFSALSPEEKVRRIEADPPIRQAGNLVRIGRLDDPALRNNVSISYELVVPAGSTLRSATGSGNQTIEKVGGPVEASTGSGEIRVTGATSVRASTGSGGIELREVSGDVNVTTGSGDVRLDTRQSPNVRVSSGSGSIAVSGLKGRLSLETGSGDVTVDGVPSEGWRIETGSGTVRLSLPPEAAFDLRAHTGSGEIDTSHPLTLTGSARRHEMRGKVRGGGPLLDIETGSGDVVIR